MISIAAHIPTPGDATSWFRGHGPMAGIMRKHPKIRFISPDPWNWPSLGSSLGVFMQRPFTKDQRSAFEIAKDVGKKVWLDYDDLLFDVPTDNPTYFKYMRDEIQGNVRLMLEHCDYLSVSTQALADIYGPVCKKATKIVVIPNALDIDVLGQPLRGKQGKDMLWRGSRTHHKDVYVHSPSIIEVASAQYASDWKWHFIGDNLWFLTDRMPQKRTYIMEPLDIVLYHRHLEKLAPVAVMVPLHDSPFNRCKSNIAWMEATYAGAVCLGPDWDEWKRPGVLNYDSRPAFKDQLNRIVKGDVNVAAHVAQSWDYITRNLLLDQVNQLRMDILCNMIGCTKEQLEGI